MTFITYAQNFEDLMLMRALRGIEKGFYIDVGANLPDDESVTKVFYEKGWHGINVEPEDVPFTELTAKRPRDINLKVVAGPVHGEIKFYQIDESAALSTSSTIMADIHRSEGRKVNEIVRQSLPLRDICAQYVDNLVIHFMKIDVEGAELQVLESHDFTRWRPWIVLIESHSSDPHADHYKPTENYLLNQNYRFIYTDGLNRFYLANEHYDKLADAFMMPPNVYDDWMRWRDIKIIYGLQYQIDALERRIVDLGHTTLQPNAQPSIAQKIIYKLKRFINA